MARDEPPRSGRPQRAVASGSGGPPAPRRRRRDAGAPPEPATAAPAPPRRGKLGKAAEGTAVLSSSAGAAQGRVTVEAPAPPAARRRPRLGVGTYTTSRPLRILAWVVALPIALVVVGIPARKAGYLTGQKLLDVIVEHDIGRFVPLLVIVALWALVTAILVTLFLDGGHWFMERRAQRRVQSEMAAPSPSRRKSGG